MADPTDVLIDAIEAGPSGPRIVAVFDFDGTLVDDYPESALLGGLPEWAGRTEDELLEFGARLFVEQMAGRLNHQAWRLAKAHQRAGHTVVIAASATEAQVAPLAEELGVRHVLCTRPEVIDGRLAGDVAGARLSGAAKLAAVRGFAADRGLDLADGYAYTADERDAELLAAVGHPHPVNPGGRLAEIASARDWPPLRLRRGPGSLDPRPALRTAAMFGTLLGTAGAGIVVGALNGDRHQGIDLATTLYGDLAGPLGGIDIEVIGEENAWAARPAVFFINHQSTLVDYLVTTRVIRTRYTAVAKAEVRQMPVIGPMFSMAGVAFLDRANRAKAIDALKPVVETLRGGTSVIMAPEGTRSLTPRLGPFKKGGFHLAMQAGVPIVPIVIRNAGEIMWRAAKTIRGGTIQVAVLPPIPSDGWTVADLDRVRDEVRQLYLDTLDNWPKDAEDIAERGTVT